MSAKVIDFIEYKKAKEEMINFMTKLDIEDFENYIDLDEMTILEEFFPF